MKKLIIIALLAVGMTSVAQNKNEMEKKPHRVEAQRLTPEQRNQLTVKKMTLALDLNATQQKEVGKLIADQSARREASMKEMKANKEAGKKLTSDQLFARKNKMLDEQIAMKENMKKILNPEQFKKWDQMRTQRHGNMKKRMMHKKHEKMEHENSKK